jgi:hypothetical protein
MSLFSWFTKKPPTIAPATPMSSGLGLIDSTVPQKLPVTRKTERLERRELLYNVIRSEMVRAGVLAASYKFKVLSLDGRGRQYLIMMDLTHASTVNANQFIEVETMVARAAKVLHDILVTAVYWRVNEQITAGNQPRHNAVNPKNHPVAMPAAVAPAPVQAAPLFDPLQQEEVEAFQRALASAVHHSTPVPNGELVTSGRRNPSPADDFEDTQRVDSYDRVLPLGVTQYGDLN